MAPLGKHWYTFFFGKELVAGAITLRKMRGARSKKGKQERRIPAEASLDASAPARGYMCLPGEGWMGHGEPPAACPLGR